MSLIINTVLILSSLLIWEAPAVDRAGGGLPLAGFKVYYGEASGQYDYVVDVGLVNSFELSRVLEPDIRYFITATTYDILRNESVPAEEITFTLMVVPVVQEGYTGKFTINPNPIVDSYTTIQIEGDGNVRIYNNRGQQVKIVYVDKRAEVSTHSLAVGVYYFVFKDRVIKGMVMR